MHYLARHVKKQRRRIAVDIPEPITENSNEAVPIEAIFIDDQNGDENEDEDEEEEEEPIRRGGRPRRLRVIESDEENENEENVDDNEIEN